MATYQTHELTGELLDAAVAQASGRKWHISDGDVWVDIMTGPFAGAQSKENCSRDWGVGGPIIDREKMAVEHGVEAYTDADEPWYSDCRHAWSCGPTPLIAAMRAFVASKFGHEVEI